MNITTSYLFLVLAVFLGVTSNSFAKSAEGFAGLTILATVAVGVVRFNQTPNYYSIIGLILIITGVLMVNLLGNK